MTDRILAREAKPGDVLDIEGDTYADPDCDPMTGAEFEFTVVEAVKWEGPGCVVLYTSLCNFGCPPDHVLKRDRHDAELAEVYAEEA